MAEPGFYRVEFNASFPGEGGMVTLDGGFVRGGDSQFLYSGTFREDGDRVISSIKVKAISSHAQSVFGPMSSFDLVLSGSSTASSFSLTGPSPIGGQGITIDGRKIASIDLK